MDTNALQPSVHWWTEQWLEPESLSSSAADANSSKLPEDLVTAAGTERDLGPGLNLYTLAARFRHPARAIYTSREPYLWFAVSRAGKVNYDSGANLTGDIKGGEACCSLLRQNESIISYAAGSHSAGGLAITQKRLAQLLDGQTLNGPIRAFLEGKFAPSVAQFGSTTQSRKTLNELFDHPYKGPIEAVYLEAKAYELVAECLRIWTEHSGTEAISRTRKRALEAREIMMANLASPPSIAEIARQVGLSQRALGNVFREVYGTTPLQCLTTWRLEAAQTLLRSGDYSVKQVAHLMGYAHQSNFSQAFTSQFGRPPTEFRKT